MAEHRFKTLPVRQTESFQIDREAMIIRNVVAMVGGVEAIGHDAMSDQKTVEMAAMLGIKAGKPGGRPVRTRLGHPGASENSAGRKLAIARNFSVQGNRLMHELHFMAPARKSPAFSRDPIEYIFDMAEEYPTEIAESVVMYADRVWVLDDGNEVNIEDRDAMSKLSRDSKGRPLNATTKLPIFRPTSLSYVDLVNEGALTHEGLFSAETAQALFAGTGNEAADEFFEMMDYYRDELGLQLTDLPAKADRLVNLYINSRGTDMKMPKKPTAASSATDEVEDIVDDLAEALESAQALDIELTQEAEQVDDSRIAKLEADLAATQTQLADALTTIEQIKSLALTNARNIRTLDANIKQLDAEPVVTHNVPVMPKSSLAALEYVAPVPPVVAASAQPKHVSERVDEPEDGPLAHVSPKDREAQAGFIASQRRQRAGVSF